MKVYSFVSHVWVDRHPIFDRCPNCESAWTGGCIDPENREFCLACSNKRDTITGWCWGFLIDPFYWIGHYIVDRNINYYKELENDSARRNTA